jgi:hypothetical protein
VTIHRDPWRRCDIRARWRRERGTVLVVRSPRDVAEA